MTRLPMGKSLKQPNGKQQDDLTRIKGIGSVKQQWLQESLQVYTIQDLASLSVDQIESQLSAKGHTTSRDEIEEWLVQAEKLASRESPQPDVESADRATEELSPSLPEENEHFRETEFLTSPERENQWSCFASFAVEFQRREIAGQAEEKRTVVRHLEANTVKIWSEIESKQLPEWIRNQLGEEIWLTSESQQQQLETQAEKSLAATPVAVEISQLRVFQPPQTKNQLIVNHSSPVFPGTISSDKPFALEIDLNFGELSIAQIVQQPVKYYAQCYARNRSTGVITHLGDTEPGTVTKSQLSYKTKLPEISLQPGIYRLQVVATLQGAPATPGFLEVPLLPVV
ncbi:hypothetical protein [Lyngbya aestuarii]|uniref:hypothetical protein n=1 Tax=Lyngbya aestuarii TaxID=118322 RepID=UPI00403DABED